MVCLLITTNTRQLGTATTTTTTTAAAAVAHSVMAAGLLKKSDYLLPTSWFYETFMPVLSEVSLRIRCSSYCSDDGAMGTLIYIYIFNKSVTVHISGTSISLCFGVRLSH